MFPKIPSTVKPDSRGRISLGHLADGVSSYSITIQDHKIILEPYAEIKAQEKWLFDNEKAREKVAQGLKDAAAGKIITKGSFAKFADDEIE